MSVVLEKPAGHDPKTRYEIRRARSERLCEGHRCTVIIPPGQNYLVCTEYPGGESGYADAAGHPVRLAVCPDCAPRWTHSAMPDSPGSEEADRG